MRAILLLLLLLAVITAISFFQPTILPYWRERMPEITECLDEGRFQDALSAATQRRAEESTELFNTKSEPRGEAAPEVVHEVIDSPAEAPSAGGSRVGDPAGTGSRGSQPEVSTPESEPPASGSDEAHK